MDLETFSFLTNIKDAVFKLFSLSGLKYEYNGDQEYGISSAVNVFIEGVASEALMLATKQYCSISNGSACNSNSYSVSYVLKAMGLGDEVIRNSIRIRFGE